MANAKRDIIRERFQQVLRETPAVSDRNKMASEFEVGCYNAAIAIAKESSDLISRSWSDPRFINLYANRCGIILGLIDPNSISCQLHGTDVMDKILDGTWTVEEVCRMSSSELCPKANEAALRELKIKDEQVFEEVISTIHECPRCGKYRARTRTVQLRSADEGSTVKCVCLECGTRFAIQN